ncbi:uncharacterized protein LOC143996435 isoform X2 [Lithobates pipiens]
MAATSAGLLPAVRGARRGREASAGAGQSLGTARACNPDGRGRSRTAGTSRLHRGDRSALRSGSVARRASPARPRARRGENAERGLQTSTARSTDGAAGRSTPARNPDPRPGVAARSEAGSSQDGLSEGELVEPEEDEVPRTARGTGPTAGCPLGQRQPDSEACLVWILGHSYVYWGARRAEVRRDGRLLGLSREEGTVRWLGIPGMLWSRVLPEIHRYARLDRPPNVVLLHVGGNDLGLRCARELIRDIKFDLLRLQASFPDTIFIWSDIVARTAWRLARSVAGLNRARVKVNKAVAKFFVRNGGLAVRHRDLEEETWRFLRSDGVHLNAIGLDIWQLGVQDGVQRAVRMWWASRM